VNLSSLPGGWFALASAVLGFVVSLPFQQSVLGEDLRKATGLPINAISDDVLHFADFAYVVGFAVAFVVFWVGARSFARQSMEAGPEAATA
jgi:hypothetical protein